MFIGRQQELNTLHKLYNSGKFEFAVIFSRCIMEYNTGIVVDSSFASFQSALEYVFKLVKTKRILLGILETLVERSNLFHYRQRHFYLFAKTGFTKGCRDRAIEMGNVTLVAYHEMLKV